MALFPKDLIDVDDLNIAQIEQILSRATVLENQLLEKQNRPAKPRSANNPIAQSVSYDAKIWSTFFLEPSTRTKLSFQIAIENSGNRIVDFDASTSSLKKNESLEDTLLTLESLGVYGAVIRCSEHKEILSDLKKTNLRILNGGTGTVAHPTQALLDLFVIHQSLGVRQNLKITYVGDVSKSRVAHSGMKLFQMFGHDVRICGPDEMLEGETSPSISSDDAYQTSDVVILLRAQLERGAKIPLTNEQYLLNYGCDLNRLKKMKKDAIILHPGPCNRGVEITGEVIDHPRCKMLSQVKAGVLIRQALIESFNDLGETK